MKRNDESLGVVSRFFIALDQLKEKKIIRGRQTFTRRYDINKRNMYYCEKNPSSGMFDVSWLVYLSRDYNISSEWLLTGNGDMFFEPKLANFSHPQIINS